MVYHLFLLVQYTRNSTGGQNKCQVEGGKIEMVWARFQKRKQLRLKKDDGNKLTK